ncbi:unnamed protein product, partial [Oppiella nova]
MPESENFSFDRKFLKRFLRILTVILRGKSSMIILYLLFVTILYETAAYNIGMITGTYYKALGERDVTEFWQQTIKALVLIAVIALLKSIQNYIASSVYLEWRRQLTDRLLSRYMQGLAYYELN